MSGTCRWCDGPLPEGRHYTEFCSNACYQRHRRLDPRRAEWDRAGSRAYKQRHREVIRAKDREYGARPEQRGACSRCGGLKGSGGKRYEMCRACRHALAAERADRIVELYEQGLPLNDIAAAIETTRNTLGAEIDRLRKAGRIGYRYKKCERRAA